MLNKLREAEEKYIHLEASLSDPAIMGDPNKYVQIMKDYKSLTPVIEAFRAYQRAEDAMRDARALLEEESDPEMRELASEELKLAKGPTIEPSIEYISISGKASGAFTRASKAQ